MGNCISNQTADRPVQFAVKRTQSPKAKIANLDREIEIQNKNELFIDEDFPPIDSSFNDEGVSHVKWIRASKIAQMQGKSPIFIDGSKPSRFDVNQGEIGDCWFLAALSDLPTNRKLFDQVVPFQDFKRSNGKFHFRFWNYGRWQEVIVDDYLPVNSSGTLRSVKSGNNCEFWSALCEKAYAKFYGNYGLALNGGFVAEAFEDLTGGIAEEITLKNQYTNRLFKTLLQAYEKNCLMSASILREDFEKEFKGLPCGHAYSVNKVVQFSMMNGKIVQLLRVRNPWGNSKEWTGQWSDHSQCWNQVSNEVKHRLDFHKKNDGEFYISIKDFIKMFDQVTICHLGLESMDDKAKGWQMSEISQYWPQSLYNGLLTNEHQFLVQLKDSDNDGLCTLLVSVMQKGARRRKGQGFEDTNAKIGFDLYRVNHPNEELPLNADFLFNNQPESEMISYRRSATKRFRLEPGSYVVMPKRDNSIESKEYLIRVCYEGNGDFYQLK